MYRFNCHLSDELGERMGKFAERAGMSKVTLVTLALNTYMDQEDMKRQLMEKMSDPYTLAEVCKAMGIEVRPEKS